MLRRLLAFTFAFLTVHTYSFCSAAQAKGNDAATMADSDSQLTVCPKEEVPVYFASGAKYDTETHKWKDRYNGKSMDLVLPGVAGRYGAQNVVADNTLVAAAPSGGATTPSTNYFTYKNFLIFTLIGLGIATSIAVPVALGVAHHHHHHHNFYANLTPQQQNQLAVYSFFHNQTLAVPKLILPPPPPVEHASGPPPQNP